MLRRLLALVALTAAALAAAAAAASAAPGYNACRPYSSDPCLLPFPDDHFTVADKRTPTGRRLHLPAAAMPSNKNGSRISPAPYDRADGFSPGSEVVVHVRGLDTPAALKR